MDTHRKSEFAVLCKALRKARGFKHKHVAAYIGIKTSTYGNVETSPWKVINRDRAERLADLYELEPAKRAELIAAWELCPLSAYGERRRARFEKMRARRSKLAHYGRMKLSLVEMTSLWLADRQGRALCSCLFGGGTEYDPKRNCEFCEAVEALGLPPGTDESRLYERLAMLAEELEAKLSIGSKHGNGNKASRTAPDHGGAS